MRIILFIIAAFFFLPATSFGQMDTIHLKEVEVREQFPIFSGISKSETDTFRLQRSVSSSLADVLAFEQGITVRTYGDGGLASISFRGADASHTKVEWNGLPINSVMNGQVDFSLIPACPTDRIDLMYGANSMAFSQGSLGGTVQIKSTDFNHLKRGIELKAETGSFGLFNGYGGMVIGNNFLKSFTRISFHRSDNNFSYLNNAVLPEQKMKQENSAFKRLNVMEEIFLNMKNSKVSLHYWQTYADRELPPLMTNVFSSAHFETQSDASSKLIGEWNYSKDCFRFYLKEGIIRSSLNYLLEHFNNNQIVTFMHSESSENIYFSGLGMRYCFSPKIIVNSTWDYNISSVKISEEKSGQGYNKGMNFLHGMIDIESYQIKWLNITALARFNKYDNYNLSVLPALYFSGFNGKKISFKAAFSYNSNFPTLNDLYFIPGGNPGLKPEYGYQADFKTIFKSTTGEILLSFDADLFYSDITNWILWQPTQYGYWTPENIRHVISRGIQTKLSAKIPLSLESNSVISGGYTYNPATTLDEQSRVNQLPYLPIHSAIMSIRIHVSKFEVNAEEICQGKRFVTQNNSYFNTIDSYLLTNVSVGYSFSLKKTNLSIELKLNNLFNQSYQMIHWRPVPGRNGSLVLSFKL